MINGISFWNTLVLSQFYVAELSTFDHAAVLITNAISAELLPLMFLECVSHLYLFLQWNGEMFYALHLNIAAA